MASLAVHSSTKLSFEGYLQKSTPLATKQQFNHLNATHFHRLDRGHTLLHHYSGFVNFLHLLYPIFKFNFLDNQKVPPGYWSVAFNRRHFLELLAAKRGFDAYPDWQGLGDKEIRGEHGRALFAQNHTILSILEENYEGFNWARGDRWPTGLEMDKKRVFLDNFLAAHYPEVSLKAELEEIDNLSFIRSGGGTILNNNGSLWGIFSGTYPELYSEMDRALVGYSGNERFIVDYLVLEGVGSVERQEDLSGINIAVFSSLWKGGTLLSLNGGSLQNVFGLVYPELVVRYRCEKRGYWSDLEVNICLLLKIVKGYDIREMKDWYRVSVEQFSEVYGKGVRKEKMMKLLEYWMPEEEWDRCRFAEFSNKRAKQRYLGLVLKKMFKEEVIFEEYAVKFGESVHIFDFYIPRLKMVVEYQGEQHYYSVVTWISLEGRKKRDHEKVKICERDGLKIVHVPYWWDNSLEGLINIFLSENISFKL